MAALASTSGYIAGMDDADSTLIFSPEYGPTGLLTAVVTDRATGDLLMVAHMNAEAFAATQESGEATFWSRSRRRLWRKGETSGNVMRVVEVRIDCDQDAVQLIVDPAGPACHTGARSCFYRRVEGDALVRAE